MRTELIDENYVLFDKQTLREYATCSRNGSLKRSMSESLFTLKDKCFKYVSIISPAASRRGRSLRGDSTDDVRSALMHSSQKSSKHSRRKFAGPDILMERRKSIKGMTRCGCYFFMLCFFCHQYRLTFCFFVVFLI